MNNIHQALSLLRRQPLCRIDLSREIGLSATSITRITNLLNGWRYLVETELPANGQAGRKAVLLHLAPEAALTVGIHIDHRSVRICLLDLCYSVVGKAHFDLRTDNLSPERLADMCFAHFLALTAGCGVEAKAVCHGAIAAVGVVDNQSGTLAMSPQFNWVNVPLASIFEQRFGLPMTLENDVKASLTSEIDCRDAVPGESVAFLQAGSGVGAAATNGGEIVRGQHNMAGEVGHIVMDPSNGIRCDCGRTGCLQTHIAERFLIEQAQKHDREVASLADLHARYRDGTPWATELISDSCHHLLMALSVLTNMYNPGRIVVNGDFFLRFGELLAEMRASLNDMLFTPLRQSSVIQFARAGESSAALGAAIIAQQQHVCALSRMER